MQKEQNQMNLASLSEIPQFSEVVHSTKGQTVESYHTQKPEFIQKVGARFRSSFNRMKQRPVVQTDVVINQAEIVVIPEIQSQPVTDQLRSIQQLENDSNMIDNYVNLIALAIPTILIWFLYSVRNSFKEGAKAIIFKVYRKEEVKIGCITYFCILILSFPISFIILLKKLYKRQDMKLIYSTLEELFCKRQARPQ